MNQQDRVFKVGGHLGDAMCVELNDWQRDNRLLLVLKRYASVADEYGRPRWPEVQEHIDDLDQKIRYFKRSNMRPVKFNAQIENS